MKLSEKDIKTLASSGRVDRMPKDTFVAGFYDIDGRYYPIYTIDAFFYAGVDCEMYTHLTQALGGIVFYLRFFL